MQIFTRDILPKCVSLTGNFQNSFHELFLILSLSLSVYAFMNFMDSIKPSRAANTAHFYHLKSGNIYSKKIIYLKKLSTNF